MFFWWELCTLPPQHWYLIDSLSRASWNPLEQVAIVFAPFSNIIWRAVCESKFLLGLKMANIHYNRTTTLEKREKIIALWTSGSKQAQIAEEVGLSAQTVSNIVNKFLHRGTYFPGKPGWKERTVSTPEFVEFVEYSLARSFLSILINVCKERSLYDITICWSSTPWRNGTAFFTRLRRSW